MNDNVDHANRAWKGKLAIQGGGLFVPPGKLPLDPESDTTLHQRNSIHMMMADMVRHRRF
jgi:hypothetical protein